MANELFMVLMWLRMGMQVKDLVYQSQRYGIRPLHNFFPDEYVYG